MIREGSTEYRLAMSDIVGDLLADGVDRQKAEALAHEQIMSSSAALPYFPLPERDPIFSVWDARIGSAFQDGKVAVLNFRHEGCAPDRAFLWLEKDDTHWDAQWKVAFGSASDKTKPGYTARMIMWAGVQNYLGLLFYRADWRFEDKTW